MIVAMPLAPTRRLLALAATGALVVVVAVTGPLAERASAAPTILYASDVASFQQAIDDVNAADGNDGLPDDFTIELTQTIDFTGFSVETLAWTQGSDAHNVVIDGKGFAITCDDGLGTCGRLLDSYMRVDASLTFTNITISGFRDGAVYVEDSDLNISGSIFTDNSITGGGGGGDSTWGGAVYARNYNGIPDAVVVTIENSYFTDNSATAGNAYGGALFLSLADTTITDTYFEDNTANGPASTGAGGAVAVYGGSLYMYGGTLEHNEANAQPGNAYGGAIDVNDALLVTSGTRFLENSADGFGGAVYVMCTGDPACAAYAANENTRFDGNSAEFGGGVAIRAAETSASLDTVVFDGNTASSSGGGLWVQSGTADVVASLFTNNSSSVGGAVTSANSADVRIQHSTITENTATDGGAAVHAWVTALVELIHVTASTNSVPAGSGDANEGGQILSNVGSTVSMFGSVVVDTQGGGVACSFTTGEPPTSDGYNFTDDTSCGLAGTGDTVNDSAAADLGPLQFNGGDTYTMLPGPDSVLINSIPLGDGGPCLEGSYDQRDVEREQGSGCDRGAVETFAPILGSIITPGGTIQYRILNAQSVAASYVPIAGLTPAAPAGVMFPFGAQAFDIDVWDEGWPADIQIFSPTPSVELWKLYGGWLVPDDAVAENTIGGTLWTYRVTDDGFGDNDGDENGFIEDPVALGVTAVFAG